ncbi:MAG: ABC-F family ATP-binding cassette domain-containing protein [Flexistipes sinusarabici]|uniref:ABC-F family ATP-binding cassette domain-containing protein n=1 Tax=Flexistipes sinusarabici TaxID=2352 RepID=A0A5D0MRD7_FLESI|nr:ABC-F family ATP-binding cassette domain-containing protein [Flexistipes sinusarabici]TYB34381.1 MAG: ABC-F family ATP-binding cassette domain-containing protein [Flexistipes sinusarabici]
MNVLNVKHLNKSYAADPVFRDVSFSVNKGEKAALIGQNGSGKSTLLKIISGDIPADSGDIILAKSSKIASISQETCFEGTLFEFMTEDYRDLLKMETEMQKQLTPDELDSLMLEYEKEGGYEYKAKIRTVLKGLGFTESEWERSFDKLSGGEKVRGKLARVLAGRGEILLLDEPTNHLDIGMIIWLENFIKNTDKTVIFVSHDRRFIRNIATGILYLADKNLMSFNLSYEEFEKHLNIEIEKGRKQRRLIDNRKKELEEFIRKYRAGIKSKQVTMREKMLDDLENQEKSLFTPEKNNTSSFDIGKNREENATVIDVNNLGIGYGSDIIKENISFKLYKGEKAALIGSNGTGKSTFLKVISGRIGELAGNFSLGSRVQTGYLDQNFDDLNLDNTIMEELLNISTELDVNDVLSTAARLGLESEDMHKKIEVLSGGEKTRVCFIKLVLKGANFLILDEPTNHLDIEGVKALKESLLRFSGAVLLVSHDRFFLDGIADKYIVFNNTGIFEDYGSIDNIIEKYSLQYQPVNGKKKGESKSSGVKKKRVNNFKVDQAKEVILEIEEQLEKLYSERNKLETEWERLTEVNKNIDSLEEELIYKYDELEKLEKGEV